MTVEPDGVVVLLGGLETWARAVGAAGGITDPAFVSVAWACQLADWVLLVAGRHQTDGVGFLNEALRISLELATDDDSRFVIPRWFVIPRVAHGPALRVEASLHDRLKAVHVRLWMEGDQAMMYSSLPKIPDRGAELALVGAVVRAVRQRLGHLGGRFLRALPIECAQGSRSKVEVLAPSRS